MGYHIRIINTSKKISDENKILKNKENLSIFLREKFNYHEDCNEMGEVYFYDPNDEESILFYDGEELLAITTSNDLLSSMIKIARSFKDGSRVVGDENETYKDINNAYLHEDDYEQTQQKEDNYIKKIKDAIIPIIVPILLGIIALILKILKIN
ncbi:hypothetical protein ACTHSF_07690 [Neisseria sp. P0001.S010]